MKLASHALAYCYYDKTHTITSVLRTSMHSWAFISLGLRRPGVKLGLAFIKLLVILSSVLMVDYNVII